MERMDTANRGRRRGAVTLMFLVIVIAIVLAVVLVGEFVGSYFSFVYKVINIRGRVNVFMVNDDAGTELVSLLNAGTGGFRNMELLGMYTTDGLIDEKTQYIDPIKSTMDTAYGGYTFTLNGPRSVSFQEGVPPEINEPSRSAILGCGRPALDTIALAWPSDSKTISSGFGGRELKAGQCDCHGGIDLYGNGVNVYAAARGIVKQVYTECKEDLGSKSDADIANKQRCNSGYGNFIVVEHDVGNNKYYSYYDHLKAVYVKAGDEVGFGEKRPIGKSGWTGYTQPQDSGGAHLHFELSFSGSKPIDKDSIDPCGLFSDTTGVTGKCDHAQVAACSYVSGMVSGNPVRSYETDVPLPGPRGGVNLKGTVVFQQWS